MAVKPDAVLIGEVESISNQRRVAKQLNFTIFSRRFTIQMRFIMDVAIKGLGFIIKMVLITMKMVSREIYQEFQV